jgi:hypothetical protein
VRRDGKVATLLPLERQPTVRAGLASDAVPVALEGTSKLDSR